KVTLLTWPAEMVADADTAVVSELVFTELVVLPTPGLVSPPMVREAAELAGSEQVAPARVMVTTLVELLPVAVAVQFENPAPSTTVGAVGTVYPDAKVTEIVSAAASAPTAVGLKLTVHWAIAAAVCGAPENDTLATAPAAMTTDDVGEAGAVSTPVATVKSVGS